MQLQADVLGTSIELSEIPDSTSLGAGFAAGLGVGIWESLEEIQAMVEVKSVVGVNTAREQVFAEKYKKW